MLTLSYNLMKVLLYSTITFRIVPSGHSIMFSPLCGALSFSPFMLYMRGLTGFSPNCFIPLALSSSSSSFITKKLLHQSVSFLYFSRLPFGTYSGVFMYVDVVKEIFIWTGLGDSVITFCVTDMGSEIVLAVSARIRTFAVAVPTP